MKKLIVGLCVLLVLSVGCSKPVSGIARIDLLSMEMWASSNCVKRGDTVKLRATVLNSDSTTRTIQLRDRPVFDIELRYENQAKSPPQEVVQTWSENNLSPNLNVLELKAGESKTIEMDWVASPDGGMPTTIKLNGILRYGEDQYERAIAFTPLHVDACPH